MQTPLVYCYPRHKLSEEFERLYRELSDEPVIKRAEVAAENKISSLFI